jgi:subtilisin family serine protease
MSLGATVTGTDDGACGWIGNNAAATMHQAICESVNAGVFYAVAGNGGKDGIGDDFFNFVPAAFDQVLTVTAIADFDSEPGSNGLSTCGGETDDTAAYFSNYTTNDSPDENHTIAAPGVCIRSTWKGSRRNPKGTYKTISGTSMASPHVAGTAALCIISDDCTGTPQDIMDKLRSDATVRPASYGFLEDPHKVVAPGAPYYGFLEYAGGY